MNEDAAARILIVDDDEEFCRAISIRLSKAGYRCVTAANGEEGYLRFEAGGIDLVLTDVVMPISDGSSMIERIRQISDVPIIAVTAYDQCWPTFVYAFPDIKIIGKPYDSDELLAIVGGELAGYSGAAFNWE